MMSAPGYRNLLGAAWLAAFPACGRAPECPEAHYGPEIAVPATQTTIAGPVPRFSSHTNSAAGGVTVAITDNRGSIAFEGRGPIDAFIFGQIPWPANHTTLYAGLGIAENAWFPFWLYCSADGRLTKFYGEMTDRDLGVLQVVDGTCSPSGDFVQMALELPEHHLSQVALTCGFSVTAPPGPGAIDLGSSRAGSLDLGGNPATVLPFHTVDCRTGCGPESWFEVHAVVSDPASGTAGLAIFYLDGSGVGAYNGFLLPSASPYSSSFPSARWLLSR